MICQFDRITIDMDHDRSIRCVFYNSESLEYAEFVSIFLSLRTVPGRGYHMIC